MKKIILILSMALVPVFALAAGGGYPLDKVDIDLDNKASLQRGAKLFVNYCLSCHSASFMRYNRMAADIGIPEELVEENLMFVADFSKETTGEPAKIGSTMDIAMRPTDGKNWFGVTPPDLSVVARSRGADWLYTYLRTFYLDPARKGVGVNNAVFKDVGMPHVLWELEGLKEAVFEEVEDHGQKRKQIVGFKTVAPGKLDAAAYDDAIRDLVGFLVYMGEPAKLVRYTMGIWVLLFLVVLFFVSYALKKEFWKDVH
jgi:ubiquinol-cytochrome c reductase cytochrome c1 subunit